ncbi:MAG: phosphatidylserine decarboxylase, partial [Chloroflexota bacterium]|nr:phosphatidylserine decarboxylase [Chloroflexota bacterium]
LLLLAAAVIATFFRDPPRHVVPDVDVAYAAADGRVLSIERVVDQRFGTEEWLRIAVFLSLANVHINRSPVAGKVLKVVRQAGGFAPADSADAEHNSAVYTLIEGAHGDCVVAQRSGLVARRIVTWSKPGELLAQGDRYGLIRFGSRTDVYLRAHVFAANVAPGDLVRAGETVIARAI